MKKIILIICILILLIPTALSYDSFWKAKVYKQALKFSNNASYTIYNETGNYTYLNETKVINRALYWTIVNMEYEFHYKPQDIQTIWNSKIGDCSDYSTLIQYFLNVNNITTTRAHGYAICYGQRVKHDWLMKNQTIIDSMDCEQYSKRGNGYW